MVYHFGFACFVALFGLACGSGSGTDDDDDGPRTGYPSGPYGVTEGSVIADLSFVTSEGMPFSLKNDVYADGQNKLLFVSTASGWCVACFEEQPALQDLHLRLRERGLFVMVSVFEDSDFRPAGPGVAAAWKAEYGLTFPVLSDQPFVFEPYYDATLTPMNMFVEVPTMKILRVMTGWDPSAVNAIIEGRLR